MEAALHEVLTWVVNLAIIVFEFMGVAVIIVAGLQGYSITCGVTP